MFMLYRVARLLFGTLYPAYASYKAVKTKNVKEYVKWMMYWIVFALFSCTETITDIFLSWFPFYYEIKIILVIWLLSPATKGSSILYRKFVHPMLSSREQEIDEYLSRAKEQSYRQVLDLGQRGVTVLMQTAIKSGGGIVNQLKKSYSLSDLSDPANDETDDVIVSDPRLIRRRKPGRSPHRSSSASSASMYFSEVDVSAPDGPGGSISVSNIRSIEDVSSGYSSSEALYAQQPLKLQAREGIASQRTSSLTRARSVRVTRSNVAKKTGGGSDESDENEVFDTNIIFLNDKEPKIDKLPDNKHESSSSETEFFDIPDSSGFRVHGKDVESSERISSNNSKNNENDINSQYPADRSTTASTIPYSPAALGYGGNDSNITACSSVHSSSSSSYSVNLSKLASVLSSLYPVSKASSATTDQNTNTDIKECIISEFGTSQSSEETTSNGDLMKQPPPIQNPRAPELRAGKYRKKLAPLPPVPPTSCNVEANTIKATLVLQPGLVRSLSRSTGSLSSKEIFLNYSPKVTRRSRHRSPGSRSGDSSSSSKMEQAFSRMMRLPKKMAQLNIPGKMREKRNSWGQFFHARKLEDRQVQSGSASNLEEGSEIDDKAGAVEELRRSESQLSVKSLPDSPLAHRRLKIIRRYVDNDVN